MLMLKKYRRKACRLPQEASKNVQLRSRPEIIGAEILLYKEEVRQYHS